MDFAEGINDIDTIVKKESLTDEFTTIADEFTSLLEGGQGQVQTMLTSSEGEPMSETSSVSTLNETSEDLTDFGAVSANIEWKPEQDIPSFQLFPPPDNCKSSEILSNTVFENFQLSLDSLPADDRLKMAQQDKDQRTGKNGNKRQREKSRTGRGRGELRPTRTTVMNGKRAKLEKRQESEQGGKGSEKAERQCRVLCHEASKTDTAVASTAPLAPPAPPPNPNQKVGIYTPQARRDRIARFHEKRRSRIWKKRIKYNCRKKLADDRPRVKGRFVRRPKIEGLPVDAVGADANIGVSTNEKELLMARAAGGEVTTPAAATAVATVTAAAAVAAAVIATNTTVNGTDLDSLYSGGAAATAAKQAQVGAQAACRFKASGSSSSSASVGRGG